MLSPELLVSKLGKSPQRYGWQQLPGKRITDYGDEIMVLGQGVYGKVTLFVKDSYQFALKKFCGIEECGPSLMREISALLALPSSPLLMPVIDVLVEPDHGDTLYEVHLVMPAGSATLHDRIPIINGLSNDEFRTVLYQLAVSVAQCHQYDVWHRDIKPQNYIYFYDSQRYVLSDFGISRTTSCHDPSYAYTNPVYTLWYRAPEILLGMTERDLPGDVWALGCIFLELLSGRPEFPGDSDIDQLFSIFRKVPIAEDSSLKKLSNYQRAFPKWYPEFRKVMTKHSFHKNYSGDLIDLIEKMLTMEPEHRITARDVLRHPYFDLIEKDEYPTVESWSCQQAMRSHIVPLKRPYIDSKTRDEHLREIYTLWEESGDRVEILFLSVYIVDRYHQKQHLGTANAAVVIYIASLYLERHSGTDVYKDMSKYTVERRTLEHLQVIGWTLDVATAFNFYRDLVEGHFNDPGVKVKHDFFIDYGKNMLVYYMFSQQYTVTSPEEISDALFNLVEEIYELAAIGAAIGESTIDSTKLVPLEREILTYVQENSDRIDTLLKK